MLYNGLPDRGAHEYSLAGPVLRSSPVTKKEVIRIYPNPATDFLTLQLPHNNDQYMILVFDLSGKLIMPGRKAVGQLTLDLSKLHPSVYIVKVQDSKGNILLSERVAVMP